MEPLELKKIIEAALLAADEPLNLDQLAKLFRAGEVDEESVRGDIREALKALTDEAEDRGYELKRVASGYRYQVRQELSPWVSRLWEEKPPRYTRALLETLALVAYKQPVTRGDIEQVRGVSVSQNIMRTLLERGWIRVVGQREVPGRPSMYGTTKEFLDYFDLKSLDQLPPLAEIRELIEPLVVEEAPAPEGPAGEGAEAETQTEAVSADVPEAMGATAATSADEAGAEAGRRAAEIAVSLDDDVEEDSDDFEAEIAAAIAAADAASERFNAPEPGAGSEEGAVEVADRPGTVAASEAGEATPAERPAQVVDVVTDLDTETESPPADDQQLDEQKAGRALDPQQPTAEVVRLPTTPH